MHAYTCTSPSPDNPKLPLSTPVARPPEDCDRGDAGEHGVSYQKAVLDAGCWCAGLCLVLDLPGPLLRTPTCWFQQAPGSVLHVHCKYRYMLCYVSICIYIYVFVYMQALKPTYNMCCMRVFLDVKLHKIGLYVYTPAWLYMYVYIYIHVCTQMISIIYGCQLDLYDVISRIYTICIHIYIYTCYMLVVKYNKHVLSGSKPLQAALRPA